MVTNSHVGEQSARRGDAQVCLSRRLTWACVLLCATLTVAAKCVVLAAEDEASPTETGAAKVIAEPNPVPVAPPTEPKRKVKGVRVEVEPWYTSTISTPTISGPVAALLLLIRVTGIPAGMEIESITMPDGRLIRDARTIGALSKVQLDERAPGLTEEPEGRQGVWFHARAQAGRGGLRSIKSPFFPISDEEITGVPMAFEGTVHVEFKQVRKVSEHALQPGIYWSSGTQRAEIVSVAHEGGVLAIQQKLGPGLAIPAEKSGKERVAEMLRVRLHLVALNRWVHLMTLTKVSGTYKFDGEFSAPGESLNINQEDSAGGTRKEIAEYRLEIDQLTGSDRLPPLVRARLLEGVAKPHTWRLEVEAWDTLVADVPVRIDSLTLRERSWGRFEGAGGPRQALADELAACNLREPRKSQAVDEYVRKLFGIIARGAATPDLRHFDNTILLKLAAVTPDNLETLCRWGARAGAPPLPSERSLTSGSRQWLQRVPEPDYRCSQFRRVVVDFAEARHKELILRYHTPQFDLLDAIRERGWLDAALPGMCALAENEPVPESWAAVFVTRPGPLTDAAILAQCRLGAMPAQQLARAAARPGGNLQHAIAAEWRAATDNAIHPAGLFHIFALACKYGVPELPGDLRVLLDAQPPTGPDGQEYESARRTLVDVFALHSGCPPEIVAARAWLVQNAARLKFNSSSQRYEPR